MTASTKDWTYSLELRIQLPADEGEIELFRHGIKSESDLIFMAQVIELKCRGPLTLKCKAIRKPTPRGKWESRSGHVSNGQVVWESAL